MRPFGAELFVLKVDEVLRDLPDHTSRESIIQTIHSGKVDCRVLAALGVRSIGVLRQRWHLLAAIVGRQFHGTPSHAGVGNTENKAVVERVRIVVALADGSRILARAAVAIHVICEDDDADGTCRVNTHSREILSSWRRFAADKSVN